MWDAKRLPIVTSIVVAMWASSAGAQQVSAKQVALAHRYFLAAHMDRTMDGTLKTMIPAMLANIPETATITAEKKQVLGEVVTEVTSGMMSKILARMEPIMAEIYSETELEAMVTFYESPIGQSMIDKSPALAAKMAPMMQSIMSEMQTDLKVKLCERKVECPAR